jgi:4-hydroxybenzoate polyprenyltransferase
VKKIKAFLQIIRWPNLVFIVITQLLFHYCIIQHNLISISIEPRINDFNLLLIILASICIAGAGNIINDYFDVNIDVINKPNKVIINQYINRRWAIFWHLVLSAFGLGLSFYVAHKIHFIWIGIFNSIAVLLLFIYSASLKKKFIVGNILISLLTAWVILVLLLPEYFELIKYRIISLENYYKIFRLGILYATFSFIISLIREVIKDIEDVDGDRQNNCKTMPIVLGINATKVFITVWLVVIIALLVIAQAYVVSFGWWLSIIYAFIFLIWPLIAIQKKLLKANSNNDYAELSKKVKWVMLYGILSMLFFAYYL